jgi:hypothetical protein
LSRFFWQEFWRTEILPDGLAHPRSASIPENRKVQVDSFPRHLAAVLTAFLLPWSFARSAEAIEQPCLLNYLHQIALEPSASVTTARKLLDRYFSTEKPIEVASLEEARILADYLGIRETPVFTASPNRLRMYNEVFREAFKAPKTVRDQIAQAGKHMDLVLDSVVQHPDQKHLRGVVVKKWKTGGTYDECSGIGGSRSVVAVGRNARSGSANLILHEQAHTWEQAVQNLSGSDLPLSKTPEFLAAHAKTNWHAGKDDYYSENPEEALAECFALYFDSERSRLRLSEDYLPMFQYFSRHFGSAQKIAELSGVPQKKGGVNSHQIAEVAADLRRLASGNTHEGLILKQAALLESKSADWVELRPGELATLLKTPGFSTAAEGSKVVIRLASAESPYQQKTFVGKWVSAQGDTLEFEPEGFSSLRVPLRLLRSAYVERATLAKPRHEAPFVTGGELDNWRYGTHDGKVPGPGYEARISSVDENTNEPASYEGPVVSYDVGDLRIRDHRSGKIIDVRYNHVNEGGTPEGTTKKKITSVSFRQKVPWKKLAPSDDLEALPLHGDIRGFVTLAGDPSKGFGTRKRYLSGRLGRKQVAPKYTVLTLKDDAGQIHEIDPHHPLVESLHYIDANQEKHLPLGKSEKPDRVWNLKSPTREDAAKGTLWKPGELAKPVIFAREMRQHMNTYLEQLKKQNAWVKVTYRGPHGLQQIGPSMFSDMLGRRSDYAPSVPRFTDWSERGLGYGFSHDVPTGDIEIIELVPTPEFPKKD